MAHAATNFTKRSATNRHGLPHDDACRPSIHRNKDFASHTTHHEAVETILNLMKYKKLHILLLGTTVRSTKTKTKTLAPIHTTTITDATPNFALLLAQLRSGYCKLLNSSPT